MYVAFLRSINIGGRRVKSPELVAVFESLGLEDVSTFLASGNVLFAAASGVPLSSGVPGSSDASVVAPKVESPNLSTLTAELEAALGRELGYDVPVTIRRRPQLESLAMNPAFAQALTQDPDRKPQVMFSLTAPVSTNDDSLRAAVDNLPDLLIWHDQDVLWLPPGGISNSALDLRALERSIGAFTVRTTNTVRRLLTKMPPSAEQPER